MISLKDSILQQSYFETLFLGDLHFHGLTSHLSIDGSSTQNSCLNHSLDKQFNVLFWVYLQLYQMLHKYINAVFQSC